MERSCQRDNGICKWAMSWFSSKAQNHSATTTTTVLRLLRRADVPLADRAPSALPGTAWEACAALRRAAPGLLSSQVQTWTSTYPDYNLETWDRLPCLAEAPLPSAPRHVPFRMTGPPWPPSPPSGPPNSLRGSLWKQLAPAPPLPPRTSTLRWSTACLFCKHHDAHIRSHLPHQHPHPARAPDHRQFSNTLLRHRVSSGNAPAWAARWS